MKKILSLLGTAVLITSGASSASCAFITNKNNNSNYFKKLSNNPKIAKYKKEEYEHLGSSDPYQNNTTHSPNDIINHINVDHFFVPPGTNSDLNNQNTKNTIKQKLRDNNPYITTNDLSYIKIYIDIENKINNQNYTDLYIYVAEGSLSAHKKIWVEISKQQEKTINLYNPIFETNKYNITNNYLDDIFLKTLVYNQKTKQVFSDKNKLTNQLDISDFNSKMNQNNAIQQGLVLLNRYLKEGFLKYNPNGHIPTRNELFYSDNNYDGIQTLITIANYSLLKNSNEDFQFDLHWNGFLFKLGNKLVGGLIKSVIMKIIEKYFEQNPSTPNLKNYREWTDTIGVLIGGISGLLVFAACQAFDACLDSLVASIPILDAIIPPIDEVLSAIFAAIWASIMADSIYNIFKDLEKNYRNSFDDGYLPNNLEKGKVYLSRENLDKLPGGLDLTFHIKFFDFWNDHICVNFNDDGILPWDSLYPSQFNPSLGTTSIITGDSNDFTISANSGQLQGLEYWLEDTSIRAKSITNLFNNMGWGDYNKRTEFANLTLTDLENLVDKPDLWNIPSGYMAIIHIKNLGTNTNKNYQVIWSNLKNSQDKTSLKDSRGHLIVSFLKEKDNLESLINEKNYQNILSRYMWIKNNWEAIKKGYNVPDGESLQKYFLDYVIKLNGINIYQLNLNTINDSNLFTYNLSVLGAIFQNQVKTSFKTSYTANKIVNIYYNPTDPLNPNIQSN